MPSKQHDINVPSQVASSANSERDCRQCLSFLERALDSSGRPQSLLMALGVITHKIVEQGEVVNKLYRSSDDSKGVVINLKLDSSLESNIPIVETTTSLRHQNEKNKKSTARIGGGIQSGVSEGAPVLTTSPDHTLDQVSSATAITIECQICGFDTRAEAGARAYVRGPQPLSIVLCSNRLKTQHEVEEVLVHELIHVYDVCSRQMDLRDCKQLAYSEVRAARDAECSNSLTSFTRNICAKDKATVATRNMFPVEGRKCVCEVFNEAIKDLAPFAGQENRKVGFDPERSKKINHSKTDAFCTTSDR